MEQKNDKKNDHVLGARGQRNNRGKNNGIETQQPHFQITLCCNRADNQPSINVHERKGYKEEHDLVVVNRSDESNNSDEQQEDAHRDDAADDVDAGHQAEPLPPCCYSD